MTLTNSIRTSAIALLGLVMGGGLIGCETKAGTGALIGGAAGAGVGAIIGKQSHGHTAGGAAIGGAAGAIGGAVIGNEMDKDDRRRERNDRYYDDRPVRNERYRDDYDR